ncbi:phosphoribosylformylglycinamidine synthase [Petrotoga miotherma DSM 10691]|uniref:Phosphoribosylformylglycinamidine synthase subunit PurS n=1 Tax=Petrotoga miotherma DSM 10691 TaxID=1434326 RepID=A0A2K1PGA5_9BACT|nr:phosphoribosylformylglycinamidine synthase subunit PurS [Petrotoga miotherma]PNS01825.1 phosphoribosylformylglycinamidine synthase [Petrotoga miotherma DSM 10691]
MIKEEQKTFRFEVKVKLREGILDPQGATTFKVLRRLNYNVESVRFGKSIELDIKEDSYETAKDKAKEIAYKILTNPVLEDFEIIDLNRK